MMPRWIAATVAVAAWGCGPSPEEAFTQGRALDPCQQIIPACQGQFGACVLDDTRYAATTFPGSLSFLVRANPDSQIDVQVFLLQQRDAGIETRIFWNEPGCSDVYTFNSNGRNLFKEFEDTNTIVEHEKIVKGGEHLVEITSDMQAKTLIAVSVIEPGSL